MKKAIMILLLLVISTYSSPTDTEQLRVFCGYTRDAVGEFSIDGVHVIIICEACKQRGEDEYHWETDSDASGFWEMTGSSSDHEGHLISYIATRFYYQPCEGYYRVRQSGPVYIPDFFLERR